MVKNKSFLNRIDSATYYIRLSIINFTFVVFRLGRHLKVIQTSDGGRQIPAGLELGPNLPASLPPPVHRPEVHLQQTAVRRQKNCYRDQYSRLIQLFFCYFPSSFRENLAFHNKIKIFCFS
jgi:hypothetical protein